MPCQSWRERTPRLDSAASIGFWGVGTFLAFDPPIRLVGACLFGVHSSLGGLARQSKPENRMNDSGKDALVKKLADALKGRTVSEEAREKE